MYQIVLIWIPTAAQRGHQGFCGAALDNTNVQSDQWCITFLVDTQSLDVIRPCPIPKSVSPLGTIFQNHTVFSIQSSYHDIFMFLVVCITVLAYNPVRRPNRNGTYIYFRDAATNAVIQRYDCGWEPEVTYTGYTIVVRFPVAPWVAGRSYYVTMDSGMFSLNLRLS